MPASGPRSISRRGFVGRAAGIGALAVAGAGSPLPSVARTTATPPEDRDVIVVGANPGITLFDAGTVTGYASLWRVDWSPDGSGNVLVLWRRNEVRLMGANAALARRLEREFTRHFPEVAGLPWPQPQVEHRPVYADVDLASGLRAVAGDVVVHMSDVRQLRSFATDGFDLGGVTHSLSLVLGPCARGGIVERGRPLPGEIQLGGTPDRPSSSAFVTDAEVWRR